MEIKTTKNGNELTVALSGRPDTRTATALEDKLDAEREGTDKVVFDIEQ